MRRLILLLLFLFGGATVVACGETVTDEPIVTEPIFFLFYTDG